MNTATDPTCDSEKQARAQVASIVEMLEAYDRAAESDDVVKFDGEELTADEIIERMQENALAVEIRPGWRMVGQTESEADMEFAILLCTGGPAVRIIGDLDRWNEPDRARVQHQDWVTPWTELFDYDRDAVLRYCQFFYFGE